MKKLYLPILFLFSSFGLLFCQEKKVITLNGYLTSLESIMFDSLKGDFIYQNLIHNRLNFRMYTGEHVTFGLELRNRLFTGNIISMNPGYAAGTADDRGLIDLSWNIVSEKSYFLNSTIDRYWINYKTGKFEITAGRQRINWGQTLVWNPNDVFNSYSVFDVDYIERPGCDAVRLQYFPSPASTAELAVKEDADKNVTAAGLFRFNRWGYDIQAFAGYADSRYLVAGTGWSGNIGSVSFRGEATLFEPTGDFPDSAGTGKLIATTGFDKIFADNSMLQIQVMYCNNPLKPGNFESFYRGTLSARDLAFSELSGFIGGTWAVTPLVRLSLSAMWIPDLKGLFAGPSLDYSLADNLDFSFIWQYFSSTISGKRTETNIGFLRFKYSF